MSRSQSVLIVDDDPEVCAGVARRLEQMGYQTEMSHNGAEALEISRTRPPGLIVLDVRMPGLDGMAVLTRLQQELGTREIPVIMLSASSVDKRQAFEAGAKFFLKKPYRPGELVAAVDAATRSASSRSAHANRPSCARDMV